MTDPFLAEIRILPLSFPPKGWASCDGQLIPLSQNTALFALLGTNYGGDGKSTFALPNLQGAVPVHPENRSVYSPFAHLGAQGGSYAVTLLDSEMPMHSHAVNASGGPANLQSPAPARSVGRTSVPSFSTSSGPQVDMSPQALSPAGGSAPHNNMMPYLTLRFAIALQGIFPHRW